MNIRPLHQSVRPSPVFLGIVALTLAGGVLAWFCGDEIGPLSYVAVFVLVVAGWLVSLCLHEFGHAYTAWKFGDHDIAVRGYLTLNPSEVHPPDALAGPAAAVHRPGRDRPARRCGLCADRRG